ncbi:hypothetical protein GHT06_016139 [Daphnia sinensis]|uniref:2-(3-amino-3-carboxypropyl)histidine synthase subunit 2 n=1 Tax=Daphnia sinensis TaxID=1820382 RepID=A0AAD5PXV9_9CRUS|nr:hypothetical protein GHT06_016139 [Daphnia sinensis]
MLSPVSCSGTLEEIYDINRIILWIKELDIKKIALQFPDELLNDAPDVALKIELASNIEVHILGDTTYGSCCADVHAATYIGAEALVHFGSACLTRHEKFPVLYIFEKVNVEAKPFLEELTATLSDQDNFIIASDLRYYHSAEKIVAEMLKLKQNVLYLEPNLLPLQLSPDHLTVSGRICQKLLPHDIPIENFIVIYIGEEGLTLTNLMFTLNQCTFYTYNPNSCSLKKECLNVNQQLRRRYFLTEKAKDAQLVGILVATLGVADHLKIIEHIKFLAKSAGKRCYTFVVGKLNPNKLANFPEIDVFVAVACPENSLLNNEEFYRPVITPYEFEIAVNSSRTWTGDYITDFRQILPDAAGYVPLTALSQDQEADVSLVSGQMRHVALEGLDDDFSASFDQISHRTPNLSVLPVGSDFLKQRGWSGLEPHIGETPVRIAQSGRRGLAAGYSGEGENDTTEENVLEKFGEP